MPVFATSKQQRTNNNTTNTNNNGTQLRASSDTDDDGILDTAATTTTTTSEAQVYQASGVPDSALSIHNTPLSQTIGEKGTIGALALTNEEHEHSSEKQKSKFNSSSLSSSSSSSSPSSPIQTVVDEKHSSVDPETTQTKEDYGAGAAVTVEEEEESDPELKDIPWQVRRMVSFTDDPTLPTITFRYFLLTVLFIVPGAFLSQLSQVGTQCLCYFSCIFYFHYQCYRYHFSFFS